MKHKPSPAMLVAIAALVVALGGSAVAAIHDISRGPIKVCVPAVGGKPVLTPKLGVCKPNYTLTEVGHEGVVDLARPTSVGAVEAVTTPATVPDPLTGGTWTQGAEELNVVTGELVVTTPTTAECTEGGGPASGDAELLLDGRLIAQAQLPPNEATPRTATVQFASGAAAQGFGSPFWVFKPGTATSHTLTVRIYDLCGVFGGLSTAHFTVDSVSLDVTGLG